MKNDNINKKLHAAPLLLALLLVFSACSAVPADNPDPVIDVPYVTVTATPDAAGEPEPTSGATVSPSADPQATASPEPTEDQDDPTPTPAGRYTTVTVNSQTESEGQLVLVNYNHYYEHVSSADVIVRPAGAEYFLLTDRYDIRLTEEVYNQLFTLSIAFSTYTGGDKLCVTSGYRSLEDQQRIYDEYAEEYGTEYANLYVARPGTSEHHTGLAVDLSTMTADGTRIALGSHRAGEWFNIVCTDYGFVLRYPEGTYSTTHVAAEPWHFRYIGTANAHAMTAMGLLTYEAYIESIKDYSFDGEMLFVMNTPFSTYLTPGTAELNLPSDYIGTAHYDQETGTFTFDFDNPNPRGSLIWYVPASDAANTNIRLPLGISSYTVSGTNDGGFIVTAEIG